MSEQQSPLRTSPITVTEQDIERRRRIVGLDAADVARIVSVQGVVTPRAAAYADGFFRYLTEIGEGSALIARRDALDEAKRLKHAHLVAMVRGEYGRDYVEQRILLGLLYGRYGLDTGAFLGAFHHLMRTIGSDIMKEFGRDPQDAFERFMSFKKVGFFDIGIIVDVLIGERERTISLQQDAIRELSTPVLQVRDGLLILPIIGTIDTLRAKQLTDNLLRSIRANRARMVVMDITGVAAVDSKVANHLIQTVAAARLMGSTVIITGLSADVAQALVGLGVDLGKINTTGDLQGGLEEAERILGYRTVRSNERQMQLQSS
jgi:rsbT co-antagonist protein RsbR